MSKPPQAGARHADDPGNGADKLFGFAFDNAEVGEARSPVPSAPAAPREHASKPFVEIVATAVNQLYEMAQRIRNDWSDFDGRALKHEVGAILESVTNALESERARGGSPSAPAEGPWRVEQRGDFWIVYHKDVAGEVAAAWTELAIWQKRGGTLIHRTKTAAEAIAVRDALNRVNTLE